MAFVAHPVDFHTDAPLRRTPAKIEKRRGLLRRLYGKIMENRQISANRDIEIFLARRGHRLTDSIERDLNDHLFNGGWQARR